MEFHPENLKEILMIFDIQILPIQFLHLNSLMQLPMHHHDPFDRLLIAQARSENMVFLSKDEKCRVYDGLDMIW